MCGGFDDLDDSSRFMVEPTYDLRYGWRLTNEMRVRLKIIQTGSEDQVDTREQDGENVSTSDLGTTTSAPEHWQTEPMLIDWSDDEVIEHAVPMLETDDVPNIKVTSSEVAVQCELLGGPLGWSEAAEPWGRNRDAPRELEIHKWEQGEGTSESGQNEPAAPLAQEDGPLGIVHSCHLVRMSQPIAWAQREWLPQQEE